MRGSLTKKHGKWYIRVELGKSPDGKRLQKWVNTGTDNKKLAERMLPQVVANALNNEIVYDENMQLSAYLQHWIDNYAKVNLRQSTLSTYKWAVNQHITPALGTVNLGKLKPLQIQAFYTKLLQSSLTPTSIRYVHNVLRQALRQAIKWQLLTKNPCESVEAPRKQKYKAQVYSPSDIAKLLSCVESERIRLPVVLAVTCGLRRGEVCGLRWQDVDFDKQVVFVRHNLDWVDGSLQLLPVKTANSERCVQMPQVAVEALQQEQTWQEVNKSQLGEHYSSKGFCWSWEDGNPVDPDRLYKWFKKFLSEYSLPEIRFHDLRHTHATFLLSQGVPIKTVSERLGHSKTAFTQDTYIHVLPAMQREAADKMDSFLQRETIRETGKEKSPAN